MKTKLWSLAVVMCLVMASLALAEESATTGTETSLDLDTAVDADLETDLGTDGVIEIQSDTEVEAEVEADVDVTAEAESATNADPEAGTEATAEVVSDATLEAELEQEVPEAEVEQLEVELTQEAEVISPALPNGFSRFFAGVGDWFTFDEQKKAKRAMERVKENKLRILSKMYEKQTGLAKSPKFAAEVEKLMQYIAEDAQKAEAAVAGIEEDSEADLETTAELSGDMAEQEVLDDLIVEEAEDTITESEDLSSTELEVLNTIEAELEESTEALTETVKDKKVKVAAKLVVRGKSLQEVKEIVAQGQDKSEIKKEIRIEAKSNGQSETRIKTEVKTKITTGDSDDEESDNSDRGSSNSGKGQ